MFSKISGFLSSLTDGTFVRFKDRQKAAETLYTIIKDQLKDIQKEEILVLGIPRGGIIMASTIAKKIACSFDSIVPSRIVAPHNQELTIGAVMNDNKTAYINANIVERLKIDKDYLNQEMVKKTNVINEKIKKYLGGYDRMGSSAKENTIGLEEQNQIKNSQYLFKHKEKYKIIILIDEGVYSGATMIVAAKWILENLLPSKVIVCATVIPKEIVSLIKNETGRNVIVESILTPPVNKFKTVGRSYQDFMPVDDEKVIEVLRQR